MRFKGKITNYKDGSGFGFIRRRGLPDMYMHISNVRPDCSEQIENDTFVEFEIRESQRKPGLMEAADIVALPRA